LRVLLDTAAFIYAATTPERLGRRATPIIEDLQSVLELSSISLVEIAIKFALGKITFSAGLVREAIELLNMRILPFTAEHGFEVFTLPPHHRDPFDRQIIAQALAEQIAVVTPDESFCLYQGLKVIW
jgi:PIN domain nuclease of toxin-antitoxin system